MDFKNLNLKIQEQFTEMQKHKLFRSSLTGQQVWDLYINGFTREEDPVFRDPDSSTHNCNRDKHFIRTYGNIVAITPDLKVLTLFDCDFEGTEYNGTMSNLSAKLKAAPISHPFVVTYEDIRIMGYAPANKTQASYQLGYEVSRKMYNAEEVAKFGVVTEGKVYEFFHFNINVDRTFVSFSGNSVESIVGTHRDFHSVFKRGMQEIPLDTLNLVIDLINQGSLLDGATHIKQVQAFRDLKESYEKASNKELWLHYTAFNLPIAKFKNTLIGVLCTELAEGLELNKACENWNKRVDPVNYKKATAPITKKQIDEAKKFVVEAGYEDSFNRRYATLDDIKASEILHLNSGNGEIKSASIFDSVKATSTRHKRSEFDKVETVAIDKFMKDILPGCTSVELFLENRHEGNLVTMFKSVDENAKRITNWNSLATNYTWTYNGNLAGKSMIKENVKAVGGKTTGAVRCSLQWNDADTKGTVDLDLHCDTPSGKVYFSNKSQSSTTTWLDVDMINPSSIGIENITIDRCVVNGSYKFLVHNYSGHKNFLGFKAEIEFDGNIFSYSYNMPFVGTIDIATVTLSKGDISIVHHLPESGSSKELWGLETNNFQKVNLVCLSPNHWGDNETGNKHYMFMLDGCKTDTPMRTFHNENLVPDLLQHRKVLEVLGATTMIEPAEKQLSGLGFNATVPDEVVLKLSGSHKRVIKVKF